MFKVPSATALFKGYQIGNEYTSIVWVSQLQFADDILILCEKSWTNIRVMKSILILFELISGLKVNFHKILLVGINVVDSWLGGCSDKCKKIVNLPTHFKHLLTYFIKLFVVKFPTNCKY
jgi:hypothetical protein